MIPIAVFAITETITKEDLKKMGWDVLWLVAGGFALGLALQDTGLAKNLIGSIPFAEWSPFPLMVGTGIICLFISHLHEPYGYGLPAHSDYCRCRRQHG